MSRFFLLFLFFALPCFAIRDADLFMNKGPDDGVIFVNNRVLVLVEETPITTMDLKKRLDYLFAREYPQFVTSPAARMEFYKISWRSVLEEQIQKHLIQADGKEMKIEISAGDVRQAMEEQFGPNVIANLEKAGVTYDDAARVIEEDLQMERVIGMRIHARAVRMITPSQLEKEYEKFASNQENIRPPHWSYRVITVRDPDEARGQQWAERIHHLLTEEKIPFEELLTQCQEGDDFSSETKISVSEPFQHEESELAPSYHDILATLEDDTFSPPIEQESRKEGKKVHRVFYLEKFKEKGIPSFAEVTQNLQNKLLQEIIHQESEKYLERLNDFFVVQNFVDDAQEYEPFILYHS